MIPNEIVSTYAKRMDISTLESGRIYAQLERFFEKVVAANSKSLLSEELDTAWHYFIIHTRAYKDYCDSKYGRFIHHTPQVTPEGFADCGAACDAG